MRFMPKAAALPLVVGVLLALTPVAPAALELKIDYQNLGLSFDTGGNLTIDQRANSIASAFLKQGSATIDSADIFNLIPNHWFDLSFAGVVSNGPGIDDISLPALFGATDNVHSLATPSLLADFVNVDLLGDLDGVRYGKGLLRIEGKVTPHGAASSVLVNPTPGDWVYKGGAVGTPAGVDGVADQLALSSAIRGGFDQGILAVLEINLSHYNNGTLIGNVNADTLFTQALLNGGFSSDSAQIQLVVTPEPGSLLLLLTSGLIVCRRNPLRW